MYKTNILYSGVDTMDNTNAANLLKINDSFQKWCLIMITHFNATSLTAIAVLRRLSIQLS